MADKPFHVFKMVDAHRWANHLEETADRSRVDLDHLYERAREIRAAGSHEKPVAHYATRVEAEQDAAARNEANTSPWITYVADYLDVDEDWWS